MTAVDFSKLQALYLTLNDSKSAVDEQPTKSNMAFNRFVKLNSSRDTG